jgi:lipopolysaccharide/colanic/teichoic acid biosynthesis glycosyltransferase
VIKRAFDLLAAGLGLILLSPLLALVAIWIKIDSEGPVFFRQERLGRGFRPFWIYKFRTMLADAPKRGGPITFGPDPRITRVGRFLRKTKLDELAQLLNVIKGEMSLVGPRPEIPQYVKMFELDYAEILKVRPGMTDLASLKFRDEAEILGRAGNPQEEYVRHVLPAKIKLAKEYIRRASIWSDVRLILKTLLALCRPRARI